MVGLINKRCGHHGCRKQPSFGVDGSNKKEFCFEHKRGGMVCINNKNRCSADVRDTADESEATN